MHKPFLSLLLALVFVLLAAVVGPDFKSDLLLPDLARLQEAQARQPDRRRAEQIQQLEHSLAAIRRNEFHANIFFALAVGAVVASAVFIFRAASGHSPIGSGDCGAAEAGGGHGD